MPDIEHPLITRVNRTGYPENVADQPECCGFDFFGSEILSGDKVVEYYGETILIDNLERFLYEQLGFVFKTLE